MDRDRASAIALRWIDIVSCAVLASALFLAGRTFFGAIARWVGDLASSLPPKTTIAGVFVMSVLATYPLIRAGGFSPRHLTVQFSYPSLWVAAALALVSLNSFGARLFPGDRLLRFPERDLWAGGAVLVAGLSVSMLASRVVLSLKRRIRPREAKPASHRNARALRSDAKAATSLGIAALLDDRRILLRWIEENSPIDSPERDFFGFTEIADRVARRLTGVELRTFAFTGPYGCGKTSLRLLVEQKLLSRTVRTCHVDGWALDETSAPEKILRAILSAITHDVDCIRLMFLPSRYTEAMRAAHSGAFKPFAEIIAGRDPTAVLEELDEVLLAANLQAIVFVEDLDRNATPDTLVQVGGLLDRLRHLRCVSFVVSLDPGRAGAIDLLRLCDYVEPIPPLRSDEVGRILLAFQNYCLSLFPGDYDFVPEDERERWSNPVEDLIFGVRNGVGNLSGRNASVT